MTYLRYFILMTFGVFVTGIYGQDELTLKDYFEGSMVQVKMDMPASSQGIDVHPMKPSPINFEEYGNRLKKFGIALYNGDQIMITKIKVKKKHIEFQLGGGGYGTWGDETAYVSAPRVQKSSREKDLEELVKKEKDSKTKKDLQRELDDLKNTRKIEQEKLEFEADQTSALKQQRIRELAAQSGSRFNIRYDQKIIKGDLTPESIKNALSKYVNFELESEAMTQDMDMSESADQSLQKGMIWEKIALKFGVPNNITQKEDCGLNIMICSYSKQGQEIEITFVEGVVVSYEIKSQ